MKKISVGRQVFIRTIPLLLLPFIYHMWVREQYTSFDAIMPYILGGTCGAIFGYTRTMSKEIKDERAIANKQRADLICYKLAAFCLVGILSFIVILEPSSVLVGYIISGLLAFLGLLNGIIFNVLD